MLTNRRKPRTSRRVAVGALVVVAAVISGCGSDGSDTPTLSAQAEAGLMTSKILGCAACHGVNGQGGVGPKWKGLAGSQVTLQDGSVVTADDDYLRRSITDPSAQRVKGYSVHMPKVAATEQQIGELLAYIKALH